MKLSIRHVYFIVHGCLQQQSLSSSHLVKEEEVTNLEAATLQVISLRPGKRNRRAQVTMRQTNRNVHHFGPN